MSSLGADSRFPRWVDTPREDTVQLGEVPGGVERNNQWRFRQADGSILERWTESVWIRISGKRAADEVVFGQPGDLVLVGSRTLEGLNLRVDPVTKQVAGRRARACRRRRLEGLPLPDRVP